MGSADIDCLFVEVGVEGAVEPVTADSAMHEPVEFDSLDMYSFSPTRKSSELLVDNAIDGDLGE